MYGPTFPRDGPFEFASSLSLGEDSTGWILDLRGQVWFTTGVTPQKPEGSGHWYQVGNTVELFVCKDHPKDQRNVVFIHRWPLC